MLDHTLRMFYISVSPSEAVGTLHCLSVCLSSAFPVWGCSPEKKPQATHTRPEEAASAPPTPVGCCVLPECVGTGVHFACEYLWSKGLASGASMEVSRPSSSDSQ